MTVGLNASQARANSQQDMIIFDETHAIMKAIIAASAVGAYEVTVSDATTMTESTPVKIKIGTVNNPTVTPGSTFIINGVTIALGSTGTTLNAIIADINDAAVPGVVASKDSDYLVLTVTMSATTVWSFEIGAGTANLALGFTAGIYYADTPSSVNYFNVWQGTDTDRAKINQMEQVIKHFRNLGYKIDRLVNTATAKTFSWYVYW